MSEQTATVLELIDAFNSIDLDRVLACFSETAEYHNIPMEKVTGVPHGQEASRVFIPRQAEDQTPEEDGSLERGPQAHHRDPGRHRAVDPCLEILVSHRPRARAEL